MDFYKKTQFLWSVVILITFMDVCNGLEGIPTWLCLGINSPFIKFKAEIEILGNNSVSLNLTKDDYTLMHHQGIEKLADFIKPVDLRNSSTGYLKSNLMKKIPSTQSSSSGRRKNYVENPISEEMDKKEIEILDDPNSESNMDFIRMEKKMNLSSFLSLSSSSSSSGSSSASSSSSFPSSSSLSSSSSSSQLSSDRKYIVPMALRNPIKESTKTQQHNEQFSTNIDDLKNHILMLQNLTKNDKNFQSKFVVFPSLQREKNKTQSKFQSTTYPTSIYSPSLFSHTSSSSSSSSLQQRRNSYGATGGIGAGGVAGGGGGAAGISSISSRIKENSMLKTNIRNEDHIVEDNYQKENITIIPQVLLLNDQTPPDNTDDERKRNRNNNNRDQKELVRSPHYRRRNFRKYPFSKTTSTTTTMATTTTTTTTTTSMATTTKQTRKNPKRQKLQSGDIIGGGNRRKSNRRQHNCKNLDTPRCRRQRRKQLLNSGINNNNNNNGNKTSLNVSESNNDHEKFENRKNDSLWMINRKQEDDEKLSRSARSNYAEKNINRNIRSSLHDIVTKDFIISAGNVASSSSNSQTTTYGEDINLNPNLCYQVGGMTYGQQNLCYHNPSIMPAVSRGARAAIQECQHQFHNRRWNCTTTDDNTVFGPMTSIGSPEMAFIHALAAATVTSFIARACRDGQLPQCGCSRSSRPKQLHDDWTWGGCGDDLEFAYKISQDFIDIREKERKREARELISVPQNGKRIEDKQQKTDNGNGGEIKNSKTLKNSSLNNNTNGLSSLSNITVTASATAIASLSSSSSSQNNNSSNDNTNTNTNNNKNDDTPSSHINPEILLELQEKITKEILNSKLQEKEMIELQEKINREILNSKAFNVEYHTVIHGNNNNNNRKQRQHSKMDFGLSSSSSSVSYLNRMNGISAKARSLMNLHNNEAGRRAVIKKTRITCKCHGISGSCSLITCWQQLSSIREIGDYLKEKYDEATEVKLNKRGRLQIKDSQYKIPTAHDLVYLDESPDWCRNSRQLQWPGTHGRVCNKTSSGLDGCAILCCGRGYNTKNRIVRERCNCKFHWCCQVKCEICVKVIEEYTCK